MIKTLYSDQRWSKAGKVNKIARHVLILALRWETAQKAIRVGQLVTGCLSDICKTLKSHPDNFGFQDKAQERKSFSWQALIREKTLETVKPIKGIISKDMMLC